ncbi:hypothetical protein Efla_001853 [Eimeria flavescens]
MTRNNKRALALGVLCMLLLTLAQPSHQLDVPVSPSTTADFAASKSWRLDGALLSGQLGERERTWTDSSSPLLYSPSLTAESSSAAASLVEDEADDVELQEFNGGPSRAPSRPPFPGLVWFSLAVVMCLSLLAFHRHRRLAVPPRLQVEDELARLREDEEQLQQRVGDSIAALKVLLPAAERLAAAVDTQEAESLLATIRKGASLPEKADSAGLLRFAEVVQESLSGVNRLHDAACKKGVAVVRQPAENIDAASSFLRTWELEVSYELGESQALRISPYVAALTAAKGHYDRVSQQAEDVLRELLRARHLEGVPRAAALLSTADELESLQQVVSTKRGAAAAVDKVRALAEAAFRNLLMTEREKMARTFHQDLEAVRELATLEGAHAREAAAAVAESGISMVSDLASTLQRAEQLVAQHEELVLAIESADTLARLVAAREKADSHEKSLQAFFSDLWLEADEAGLPEIERKEPYKKVANKVATAVAGDKLSAQVLALKCQEVCAKLFPSVINPQAEGKLHVNEAIATQMMTNVQVSLGLIWDLSRELENIERQMLEAELPIEEAKEAANRATAIAMASASVRGQTASSLFQLQLLGLVEADAANSVNTAAKAAAHQFTEARLESLVANWLLDELEGTKRSLKASEELVETIRLAADLSVRADKVGSIVYADRQNRSTWDLLIENTATVAVPLAVEAQDSSFLSFPQ